MNRLYLSYLFRKYKVLILFFLAAYLCICLLLNLFSMPTVPGIGFYSSAKAAMALSVGLTFVLPVLVFSFVHKRNSADVFFALPISRKELRLTSLAFSFLVAFGYWFITSFLAWLLYARSLYHPGLFLLLSLYAAGMIFGLLVIHSFLYLIASNVLDGLVLLCAYTFFPIAAFLAEIGILEQMVAGYFLNEPVSVFLSAIYCFGKNYAWMLSENGWLYASFSAAALVLAALYTVTAWFGLKREMDERKTERAEMISDHPLSYPFVIHLYLFLSLSVVISDMTVRRTLSDLIFLVLLLVCYIAGTFLYRRKLEIRPGDLIIFLLECLASFLLMSLMWHTHGFGMADRYSLREGEALVYDYNISASFEDLSVSDGSENAYVYFTLSIPEDRMEEYQEAVDLLEAYRKEAIDDYYRRDKESIIGYLGVFNTVGNTNINRWNYQPERGIPEADLLKLSEYADVRVRMFRMKSEEDWEEYEVPVKEYLKDREKWMP